MALFHSAQYAVADVKIDVQTNGAISMLRGQAKRHRQVHRVKVWSLLDFGLLLQVWQNG